MGINMVSAVQLQTTPLPHIEQMQKQHLTHALAPASSRASARKMEALLAPPPRLVSESPTKRFLKTHPLDKINQVLYKYRMTASDLNLFKRLIAEEQEGFLGYQAGSSTVRFFQDLLAMVVKHVLNIPIKDDFVFLRVPGDDRFHYETAEDFLKEKLKEVKDWDAQPDIRQHILSMNMNLYQSYDRPWDLTPRYYLENSTWTHSNLNAMIKPFFEALGISPALLDSLWNQGIDLLPHHRGYILQFFDQSQEYEFAKQHSYVAYSGGRPHPSNKNHEILFDDQASDFPQMRLVLSNESTLNPFSPLSIKRSDCMTDQERTKYETSLRALIEKLPFDAEKVLAMREKLLKLWL